MKLVKTLAKATFIYGIMSLTACNMKNNGLSTEGYIGKSDIVVENGVMTPEALLAFGRMSDPQVSPDGKYIMYGVSYTSTADNRSVRNLYICNIDGSQNQLLTQSGKSISNARWSNDGKSICFITGGQIWKGEVKRARSGKWSLKNCQQISDVPAGVGEFKVSPDEKKIMYISYVKSAVKSPMDCYADLDKATAYTTDDLMYRHWDHTVMEIPHTFVADFDLAEGKLTGSVDILEGEPELYELPTEPWSGLEQLSWSPDSKLIAYSCRKLAGKRYAFSTNTVIYIYNTV